MTLSYANDEDVALRAPADFGVLCPKDQVVARGSDGLFLVSDPWTLRSPSVNFAEAGLAPGQMVRLAGLPAFGPSGDFFAVASVGPGGLTLRRQGQRSGVGSPPSPPAGASGVEFVVRTLAPQIERACRDLNRRFGIDEAIGGRRPDDLLDRRDLADAAVLAVLAQQYLDQARRFDKTPDEPADPYGAKAKAARTEFDDLLGRLVVRWQGANDGRALTPTTRFSTRISR